jgi:DNA ligase (NAD+)
VAHSRPMISLDNTYNEEDLKDFDERVKKNIDLSVVDVGLYPLLQENNIEYTLELKFD